MIALCSRIKGVSCSLKVKERLGQGGLIVHTGQENMGK